MVVKDVIGESQGKQPVEASGILAP
jgi:hypothetical protein